MQENKIIKINGQTKFMGINIPIVEGGFGENQKCVLAKDIAIIHEVETKYVNKLINSNIKRFNSNDLINLLSSSEELRNFAQGNNLIGSNRTKDVFILSERGYTKLVSMMDNSNEKKWEVMDKFIEEYFTMKQIINSDERLKADLLLHIYNGGQEGILASKQLTELEVKEAVAPLELKIEEDKPLVDFGNQVSKASNSIDMGQFAKVIKDEHIKLGRNQLFDWMRDNDYLRKNNEPYQQYINQNIFETKEYTYKTPYGVKTGIKTLVTGKGQIYLVEKLRKEFSN